MDRQDIKVLLIDDVQAVRIEVAKLLSSAGFNNVTVAESGVTAQKLIQDTTFQLILCDWHMAPIDGLGVLQSVREASFDTLFIMLTAEDAKDNVIEAITNGIDDYIIKPLTLENLTSRFEKLLKKKKVLV